MSLQHSVPQFDNPEAYAARAEYRVPRITGGADDLRHAIDGATPWQQEQVARESSVFGINPDHQPDEFLAAHNRLLDDMELDLQERLPRVKALVVERTAAYFSGGDRARHDQLEAVLVQRLEGTTKVKVADGLAAKAESAGHFNGMERQPILFSGELIRQLDECRDGDDYEERVERVILAHEVMHGIFAAGTQDTIINKDASVRNGLQLMHIDNPMSFQEFSQTTRGTWLNEATLESFRQTIMDTKNVRYEPGIMVLHMLDHLSPGIRDEAVIAALDGKAPGPLFGKIEAFLGPTGIDEVGEEITKVATRADFEAFKDSIVSRLPQDMQERGRLAINQAEQAIYEH